MILRNKNRRSNSRDWASYYKKETCLKIGINPDLPLTICGQEPEPQNSWNDQNERYDGPINGFGYWVTQSIRDSQGNVWKQNPVLVVVDGNKPLNFEFGQQVKFHGLAGYYSRRKYKYLFRAKGVENA